MDTADASRMQIRRVPFDYPKIAEASEKTSKSDRASIGLWHQGKPEFAHIVNSASLAMPFLEPYLIKSMRQAKPLISDANLQGELDLYITQEARHSGQHKQFNKSLADAGYKSVQGLEARLAADYKKFADKYSLKFNLAYAEGFEAMALAVGHMLIEEREYLFKDSEPVIASLVLWHFVEEIEHKNVAYEVFDHLHGGYLWRIWGLLFATGHIFWRTGQGYRALLREDGLWQHRAHRWALRKQLWRIMKSLVPKWLRILKPGYHPDQVPDPSWAKAWAKLFDKDPQAAARLDTRRIADLEPQT